MPAAPLSPFCRQLVNQLGQTTMKRWSEWLPLSASTGGESETERLWIDANRLAARGIVPSRPCHRRPRSPPISSVASIGFVGRGWYWWKRRME